MQDLEKRITNICKKFYEYEQILKNQNVKESRSLLTLCKRVRYNVFYKFQCYTGKFWDFESGHKNFPKEKQADLKLLRNDLQMSLQELKNIEQSNAPTAIKSRIRGVREYAKAIFTNNN